MISRALHLNLDDAWVGEPLGLPVVDARDWGPRVRFSSPTRLIDDFYRDIEPQLSPFLLFGSGDFHHLSALWARRVTDPFVLVSFDNHPDWDVRPPKWACGGWVNRAMELPPVRKVSVWGCGNFECWWPHQFFGNRRAEREGKLEVYPWADDRPFEDPQRRGAIRKETWRGNFEKFVNGLNGTNIYVTIDLDCLRVEEAVTNWENGRFEVADLIWALTELRKRCPIVAGDICGAFSEPRYARWKQKFASEWDHPKPPVTNPDEIRRINFATIEKLWPVLAEL